MSVILETVKTTRMIYGPLKQRTLSKLEECKGLPFMTGVYMKELQRCEKELMEADKLEAMYEDAKGH